MRKELINAFPSLLDKKLSDQYIEEYTDLMWDIPKIPLIEAVPLYMLWCVDHFPEEGSLVYDDTIGALNKYARSKDPSDKSQDFKFCCNDNQISVVRKFLRWCKDGLILSYEPTLSRTIRNWQAVNKSSNPDAVNSAGS